MTGRKWIAAAAVAALAGAAAEPALAQGDRYNETSARLVRELGYYGTWTVRGTRISGPEVLVRATATLERPQSLDGVVRIRCLTPFHEYVCFKEVPLAVQSGTRQQRTCRTRVVRRDGRRRRVRRCTTRTVPIESTIETTVAGAYADGSPAPVYEVIAYYVVQPQEQAITSSGALGVPW